MIVVVVKLGRQVAEHTSKNVLDEIRNYCATRLDAHHWRQEASVVCHSQGGVQQGIASFIQTNHHLRGEFLVALIDVWMVNLGQLAVSFLNLLWCRVVRYLQQ